MQPPINQGLVAVATDDEQPRMDYYGVSLHRRDEQQFVKVHVLANSCAHPFLETDAKPTLRPIQGEEHFRYLRQDARGHGMDVKDLRKSHAPYHEVLRHSVLRYFTQLSERGVRYSQQEIEQRTRDLRVPYRSLGAYRIQEAERFLGGLRLSHRIGIASHAQVVQGVHDFSLECMLRAQTLGREVEVAFDVRIDGLVDGLKDLRLDYMYCRESFDEQSARVRRLLDKALLDKRYSAGPEPPIDHPNA